MNYYDEDYERRMNKKNSMTRAIALFILLFAIVFVGTGRYMDKSLKERIDSCTGFLFGEITNVDSRVSKSKDSEGHVTYTTLYRNTYKYTVDKQEYTLKDSSWNNIENTAGEKMAIYYDIDNPEISISQKDLRTSSLLGTIFMFIGAILFVLSLSLNLAVIINKRRERNRIDEYENFTIRKNL